MKIRTDFVTNSSSVSYIISMNLEIVNTFLRLYDGIQNKGEEVRICRALRDIMLEKGTLTYLHEHAIYTYLVNFNDDDESAIDKATLTANGESTNSLEMNEEDLFCYLRGEFILRHKLSDLINGFGVTQVEQY